MIGFAISDVASVEPFDSRFFKGEDARHAGDSFACFLLKQRAGIDKLSSAE